MTALEANASTVRWGYLALNQAERAPGYEPPIVIHLLESVTHEICSSWFLRWNKQGPSRPVWSSDTSCCQFRRNWPWKVKIRRSSGVRGKGLERLCFWRFRTSRIDPTLRCIFPSRIYRGLRLHLRYWNRLSLRNISASKTWAAGRCNGLRFGRKTGLTGKQKSIGPHSSSRYWTSTPPQTPAEEALRLISNTGTLNIYLQVLLSTKSM